MRARPTARAAVVLSLITTTACGLQLRGATTSMESAPGPTTVDAAQISRSGARTVWEALQRTVRFYIFHSNGRIEHRGRSSIVLPDDPIVELDGIALTEPSVLTSMNAADVELIEVLSGIDATTFYGTKAGGGLIRIHTKSSS